MTKEIPLTQGQVTTVDEADYESLRHHKWYALRASHGKGFYAARTIALADGKRRHLLMHRVILNVTDPSVEVDHRDQDRLNNKRANLRKATRSQNACNSVSRSDNKSGFKGISWRKDCQKWTAQIRVNGKKLRIGTFADKDSAIAAYARMAKQIHGEFVCIPQEPAK